MNLLITERHSVRSLVLVLCGLLCAMAAESRAGIVLLKKDATVWSQNQIIRGRADGVLPTGGVLSVNGVPLTFVIQADSTFALTVRLHNRQNTLVAQIDSAGVLRSSDTLHLTLGFTPRPDVEAYAKVSGRDVTLHARVLDNPDSAALGFTWTQHTRNPAVVTFSSMDDSVTTFPLPATVPFGEYYFSVYTGGGGDTVRATTMVSVDSSGIRAFDARRDRARWIDSAIVYCVTPHLFVDKGRLQDVTAKIPELVELGINTLWLQPIFPTTEPEHGYHVLDYFSVRSDVGTESDLRTLVQTAHALGVRVLLDMVPNHTTIYHSYAQDAIRYGPLSHYYDFYQRKLDDTAWFASDEHLRSDGQMKFVYYFWETLVNLNYENAEVRRMMTEAGKYWIEKFDLDGYRIDAVWAPDARTPAFMKEWRLALKRLKPDVLLLGETQAVSTRAFDDRYDAAYDWNFSGGWLSGWSWGYGDPYRTIFNNSIQNVRAADLRKGLTNGGKGYPPNAKIFRYLENNDTPRFLATHDQARLRMAAALLFTIHGIPMLYNGQEIGSLTHPYDGLPFLNRAAPIRSNDRYGLFPFYQYLAGMRKRFPEFTSDSFEEVPVAPGGSIFAYHRWEGAHHAFGVLNMGASASNVVLQLPVSRLQLDSSRTYYLTDMMTGEIFTTNTGAMPAFSASMNPYSTRILILDTHPVATSVPGTQGEEVPVSVSLAQNYPNPFNSSTTIGYGVSGLGARGVKLAVYDILGREVAVLVNGPVQPGEHAVQFNAQDLASGMYICSLRAGGTTAVRKMMLLK